VLQQQEGITSSADMHAHAHAVHRWDALWRQKVVSSMPVECVANEIECLDLTSEIPAL